MLQETFFLKIVKVTTKVLFSKRCKLLTKKLILQGYNKSRLKSSFRKYYGRYNDLVCDYKLSLAHMLNDLFHFISLGHILSDMFHTNR
jgi:hypothetical protein